MDYKDIHMGGETWPPKAGAFIPKVGKGDVSFHPRDIVKRFPFFSFYGEKMVHV